MAFLKASPVMTISVSLLPIQRSINQLLKIAFCDKPSGEGGVTEIAGNEMAHKKMIINLFILNFIAQ